MPFSFLNPWLLLGALAIAAPLWLHLRRRTETNVLRFPTLRFLDDTPEPRASPLRLQDVLLFLLRAISLLLLVAAFAWPYWRDRNQAIVRESRVYILDSTLSHQARDGWQEDRGRIVDELGKAGAEIQVAVIELAGQPRVVTHFADDREQARQKIRDLVPSFQRGSYLAAFRQAHSLLANSMGNRKRIIFLGDNQENQWAENLSVPPFLRDIEVELPKPAHTTAPNLSLAEPRLQRIFLGEKSIVNFTVKLRNQGSAKTAKVVLRANDQTIFSRTAELERAPGSILLQAQWEADPAQWLRGEVSVEAEPDGLSGDNRSFFTLPPVREGRVAVLALSPYLRMALSPEVMRGHWLARFLEPTALSAELAANNDAEVLLLESGYLQSEDARKLVWRYLTNGRGVILVINRVTPAINGALRELGFEAQAPGLADVTTKERFQYIFSNHAIFHPFLSPDYGNLLEVTVGKHPRVKAAQAMPLIFSESGEALFFQGTQFPGRLFVSAFGFEREQTSWGTHVTFIPFLDLCLQNSRPEDATPLDYEPGATTVWNLPADSPVREVVLRDGPREFQRAPVVHGKVQLRLPDQPGIYVVSYDAATEPEKILSVNPSPKESELTFVPSPEAMKLWRLDRAGDKASTQVQPTQAEMSLSAILQQRVWWWLLVAGIVGLLAEMTWTAARRKTV